MNNWEQLDPAGIVQIEDLVQGQYYCCVLKESSVFHLEVLKFKFDNRMKKFALLTSEGFPYMMGNIETSANGAPLIFSEARDAAYYGITLLYAFADAQWDGTR